MYKHAYTNIHIHIRSSTHTYKHAYRHAYGRDVGNMGGKDWLKLSRSRTGGTGISNNDDNAQSTVFD